MAKRKLAKDKRAGAAGPRRSIWDSATQALVMELADQGKQLWEIRAQLGLGCQGQTIYRVMHGERA